MTQTDDHLKLPIGDGLSESFVPDFGVIQQKIHHNAVYHGFWNDDPDPARFIALMHSELSEALEALRKGNPASEKIAGSHLAEELADCIIRIMDFAGGMDLDVGQAIVDKHNYNIGRSHKHGKEF